MAVGKVPRGMTVQLVNPEHASDGSFSKEFYFSKERRTTLDTGIAKHRYLKELDPM